MSATALARASSGPSRGTVLRPRPRVFLVGAPVITRPSIERVERAGARMVIAGGGGNWQDMTKQMAAMCNPGAKLACGCPSGNCGCGMANAAAKYNPNAGNTGDGCDAMRWVPLTLKTTAVVAAGAAFSVQFAPQAPFKLAQGQLSSALAADLTNIVVAVADNQSILPLPVDGTYFDVASNQDGAGRVDADICWPGQLIVISGNSTAGAAAGAIRFNIMGAWGGR